MSAAYGPPIVSDRGKTGAVVGGATAEGPDHDEPRDDLAAIVRSASDAILSKTLDGTITSWNAGAERLYGYTAAEAVGQHVSLLVPDDSPDELPSIFQRLRAGREVATYETRRRCKDGRIVDVSLTISPLLDAAGNVIGASAIARDVSEMRRTAARMGRLLEVTAGLAGAITVDDVARTSVDLALRASGADGAVLALLEPDGATVRLVAIAGYEGGQLSEWHTWPLSDVAPVNDAIRDGRLVSVTGDEFRERYAAVSSSVLPDTRAAVALPLATDGPPFGALGLRFTHARPLTVDDRDELRALGSQCAIALERARAFEAERAARDRVSFLARAGEALAASLDVDTILTTTAHLAVDRLADWCGVSAVRDDGSVRRFGFRHVDPDAGVLGRSWWQNSPFPASRDRGAPNVIRTGTPELTPVIDPRALERFADPSELALLRQLGLASSMVVPLVARGRTLGALTLVRGPDSPPYGDADLELATDLARRAALAADNARLFSERAHVARRLQESLLPVELPAIPGVSLAARYLASGEGLDVGGDFYDVFTLGGDAWALVIGDVCGKGADAAGVTALARYTLRALAHHTGGPDVVLGQVNDALVRQNVTDERFLTMAYGVLSAGPSRSLTLALAGHPHPVVVRADGRVERAGAPGTLLGVFPDVSVENTSVMLGAGDAVVLFTDGVTEAHGSDGLFGDDRLESTLHSLAGASADEIAGGVADAVTAYRAGDASEDDMAVLVVQITD
jgi:PAS domain S-box-containing protein